MAGSGSESSEMWNRVPLVVILGPTGVGKSKLSLELAKRFSGEIISADSMQVYNGLDVITNKVTPEERAVAPHHMLDFLDPLKKFTVAHFRNMALPIIRDLRAANKLPVVVGGTHYYIESLLWDILVEDEDANLVDSKCDIVTAEADLNELEGWLEYVLSLKLQKFQSLSTAVRQKTDSMTAEIEESAVNIIAEAKDALISLSESTDGSSLQQIEQICEKLRAEIARVRGDVRELLEVMRGELELRAPSEMKRVQENINKKLHGRLMDVDPQTATVLHYNSRRKILRALQIHASKGVRQSDILTAQRSKDGGSLLGGPLRFKDAIMFWIRCEEDVLDKRLDDRVDDMMSRGLANELLEFHKRYNEDRLKNVDSTTAYTQGIFQSIGFKEFHSYLTMTEEERSSDAGRQRLAEGVAALKAVTRRYARRQVKWIKNRFLRSKHREVPPIYGLDATDLDTWDDNVLRPAVEIVGNRLALPGYSTPSLQPLPREDPVNSAIQENHCAVCNRIFIDTLQWSVHLESNRHKRMLKKRKREQAQDEQCTQKLKVTTAETSQLEHSKEDLPSTEP